MSTEPLSPSCSVTAGPATGLDTDIGDPQAADRFHVLGAGQGIPIRVGVKERNGLGSAGAGYGDGHGRLRAPDSGPFRVAAIPADRVSPFSGCHQHLPFMRAPAGGNQHTWSGHLPRQLRGPRPHVQDPGVILGIRRPSLPFIVPAPLCLQECGKSFSLARKLAPHNLRTHPMSSSSRQPSRPRRSPKGRGRQAGYSPCQDAAGR